MLFSFSLWIDIHNADALVFDICVAFIFHFKLKINVRLAPANKQPYKIKIMEFYANKINCIIHMCYSDHEQISSDVRMFSYCSSFCFFIFGLFDESSN